MAAGVTLFEKLESLPLFDEKNFQYYKVRYSGIELTVKGSNSFEAAVKMGFLLKEMEPLANPAIIAVTAANRDEFSYKATQTDDSVAIELQERIAKDAVVNEDSSVYRNTAGASNTAERLDFSRGEMIHHALSRYFGFPSFRPLQRETIESTLAGQDVLTVVGTGGGKTLMFLLPAVLSSELTLVVLPIKSLVDDTLLRCLNLNISCVKFTGDVPQNVREEQLKNIDNVRILLTTPECLAAGEPLRVQVDGLHAAGRIDRIVFDEAHTISTWGNTFRPVYRDVCESLSKAQCPKLLLSATVPRKVENVLRSIFGDFTVHRTTVFRDNLFLEVVERSGKFIDELAKFISEHETASGIVYCVLPSDVSKIHAELVKRGINAVKYHGQLSEEVKVASQAKWMNGEVNIIITNSSFGMGIDKANVRYVIHARLPTSIDEYYQQCGRAGRDGLASHCMLYYNYSDKNILYRLFQAKDGGQYSDVNDLIVLLEDPVHCRHQCIMNYFGERQDSFVCLTGCDNCKHRGSHQVTDGTSDALKVVQAVVELNNNDITCNNLKLFLAGSNQKCVSHWREFSTFGSLGKKFVPVSLLAKFLHLLIVEDILAEKIYKKGSSSSLSIEMSLGGKAHDLLGCNKTVVKYEKT